MLFKDLKMFLKKKSNKKDILNDIDSLSVINGPFLHIKIDHKIFIHTLHKKFLLNFFKSAINFLYSNLLTFFMNLLCYQEKVVNVKLV